MLLIMEIIVIIAIVLTKEIPLMEKSGLDVIIKDVNLG